MFSNLRSLIFKLDPETAHNLAIKSLKFNFVPNVLDVDKDNPLFKTKLFNKDLENPIGMAAGFDKNAEVYNSLFKLGFGFVEVGTITPLKQYGNSKPRVFRLVEDEALINRLGFNNHGAKTVLDRIKSNKKLGFKVSAKKWTGKRLYSLTLVERETCPTSCHHWNDCYGNNMPFAHRFSTEGLIPRLEQEIKELMLKHKEGIVIRLHVPGDFYSTEYVEFWQDMLLTHPKLCLFGYTARRGDNIASALWMLNKRFSLYTFTCRQS